MTFSSAALVSLLTGFAFATAIIGGAVFVDRVLYGGPDDQRLALGALAAATAVGALVSGFAVRALSLRLVTLVGLVLLSAGALVLMSGWTPAVAIATVAAVLGALRARLRADGHAAEHRGRRIGRPGVVRDGQRDRHRRPDDRDGDRRLDPDGLRLDPDRPALRPAVLGREPGRLEGRRSPPSCATATLRDALVVEALEGWAAREASSILVGIFLVGGRRDARRDPAGPRARRADA